MAERPKTLCTHCRKHATRNRPAVCDECKSKGRGKRQPDRRISARKRGYDWQWEKFRAWYLMQFPLCADCQDEQRLTPAKEVHHKQKLTDRPDLKYEPSNLLPLCKMHHSRRTGRGE